MLKSEGRNPSVVMEVFASADGILCGMDEVLTILCEALPKDARVWALNDGAEITKKVKLIVEHKREN